MTRKENKSVIVQTPNEKHLLEERTVRKKLDRVEGGCSLGHRRAARAVAFHAIQFFRGVSSPII